MGKSAFLPAFFREFAIVVYVHFKTWVIFFLSFFLSCRSPVPTATSFLPTQRLQLGRAGLGLSQLSLWWLPAKYSYGVSRGVWGEKEIAWSGYFSPHLPLSGADNICPQFGYMVRNGYSWEQISCCCCTRLSTQLVSMALGWEVLKPS